MTGKKGRRRKGKVKRRRIPRTSLLIIAILIVVVSLIFLWILRPSSRPYSSGGLKAVIVDGLSEEFPNPEFIRIAKSYLEVMGYSVDVFNGSRVTIDLYKRLPSMGYKFILFRVHGAPMSSGRPGSPGVALFSTEPFKEGQYFFERLSGVVEVAETYTRRERFFAASPLLFEEAEGDMDGAVIVVLSCYGFVDDYLARIFLSKGAKAYIGWSGLTDPKTMDEATQLLLKHLALDRMSLVDAVEAVKRETEDPSSTSVIRYMVSGEA